MVYELYISNQTWFIFFKLRYNSHSVHLENLVTRNNPFPAHGGPPVCQRVMRQEEPWTRSRGLTVITSKTKPANSSLERKADPGLQGGGDCPQVAEVGLSSRAQQLHRAPQLFSPHRQEDMRVNGGRRRLFLSNCVGRAELLSGMAAGILCFCLLQFIPSSHFHSPFKKKWGTAVASL